MAVILLLATAGCAGQAFVPPQPESLILGKTTEADIRERFGDPYREGAINKHGEAIKSLSYAHAAGAASLVGGVTPARGQGFYFWNAVLVGHDFTSSFDEDKTDFDEQLATSIKKGQSTKADVVKLLGPPAGEGRDARAVSRAAGSSIVYTSIQRTLNRWSGDRLEQERSLRITFDEADIVRDVVMVHSGPVLLRR